MTSPALRQAQLHLRQARRRRQLLSGPFRRKDLALAGVLEELEAARERVEQARGAVPNRYIAERAA